MRFLWASLFTGLRHSRQGPPLWLLFALFTTTLSAQDFVTIRGTVLDTLAHQPLGGVAVLLTPDGLSTVTDTRGAFEFKRANPGEIRLRFDSPFHHTAHWGPVLCREGDRRDIVLLLTPITVTAGKITVTGDRDVSPGITEFLRPELEESRAASVGEFLTAKGYWLSSDGRHQYVALRGVQPERTLVLIDGVAVNPDGGAVDLSQIPTKTVERIEVHTAGAAARFGGNSLGGAVNIISRSPETSTPHNIEAGLSVGSFRGRSVSLMVSPERGSFLLGSGYYSLTTARNDFEYEHPYEGTQRRANNARRDHSGYLVAYTPAFRDVILRARWTNAHSGVPGAIHQEASPSALARSKGQFYTLSLDKPQWRVSGHFQQLEQSYRDHEAFIPFESRHLQTARLLQAEGRVDIFPALRLQSAASLRDESFWFDDILKPSRSRPEVDRTTTSFAAEMSFDKRVGLMGLDAHGRARIDRVAAATHFSPFAAVGLKIGRAWRAGVTASYSESFRLPPLDALFWQGDVFVIGNPDLLPETAITRDVSVRLECDHPLRLSAEHTLYRSDFDNIIIWRQQFDGKFKPANVSRSRNTGDETRVELSIVRRSVLLTYNRSTLRAVNLASEGGYFGYVMPFRPDRLESIGITAGVSRLRLTYRYSYTGRRFIREANTKLLPPYEVHDLVLSCGVNLLAASNELQVGIYNLDDERYELLERVPMPGRTYRITLTVHI